MATFDTSLLGRAPSLQPNLPEPVSAAGMYNQMAKIRADRDAIQQTNFLRQAYAQSYNPQTGDVDYNTLARTVAQSPYANLLPQVAEAQQAQAKSAAELELKASQKREQESLAGLHTKQTEAADVEAKLKEADQAYNDVINFNSLDEMLSHAQEKLNSGVLSPDRFALVKSTIDQARNMKLTSDQQLNFAKSTFLLNTLNAKDRYAAMNPEPTTNLGKLQVQLKKQQDAGDKVGAAQTQKAIDLELGAQTEDQRLRAAREAAQNVDNAPLSHAALVNAATMYNINGTLPPFGMGKNAASQKVAILNMASLLSQGVDPNDAAMIRISNKANQSALTDITKREAITGSFEKNFTKNVDIVDEYSGKVDRTGVPIVNKWLQSGKRAVTGDADLKAYDLAIKTVVNEYAKIINASTSSAATAVSEINDMKQKLAAADTPEAVAAVISVMKRETANRMQGYKEQKAELTRAFTPNKTTTPPPAGAGAGANKYKDLSNEELLKQLQSGK